MTVTANCIVVVPSVPMLISMLISMLILMIVGAHHVMIVWVFLGAGDRTDGSYA